MDWIEIDLSEQPSFHTEAAKVLRDAFLARGITSWPNLESACKEVDRCVANPYLCLGLLLDGKLAGWAGLRPM